MNLSSHQLGLGINKWGFLLPTTIFVAFFYGLFSTSREADMKQKGPSSRHMYVTEHNHHTKCKHLLGDSKSCLTLDAKHRLWSTQAVHISSSRSTPTAPQFVSGLRNSFSASSSQKEISCFKATDHRLSQESVRYWFQFSLFPLTGFYAT